MNERGVEQIRTLGTRELEDRLQAAAAAAGLRPLDRAELLHLVNVLTSHALLATSVVELRHFQELVDKPETPQALRQLATGDADEETIHRALAVPDHVRVLGDKCLFETGVARRRGPKGLDLADLGRRSYLRASQLLATLSQDPRLCRYYEENALDAMPIDEEVEFLGRCAESFPVHVRLLGALVHGQTRALLGSRHDATSSQGRDLAIVSAEARSRSAALAPVAPAPGPRRVTDEDPEDGPPRIVNMKIAGRSDEEHADDQARELLAAEKTVLFSALDTERLRDELKKVVIRQDAAIDSLCDEMSLYSTGTQDPRKPASYFLVGPTGVGKNYLVESMLKLFERLWGIEVPYLELEGPEFTYPSDINELKGAARGFIRSDEEGVLTQFHKRAHDKPFSVILVDEVEKAHPQLRRFFLPIMDRGVMMDNRGRVLHFASSMIFFTSNVGYSDASRNTQPIGFGDEDTQDRALEAFVEQRMRKTLSPEFINRVHVIHFAHLTRGAVDDIFDLEIAKIRRRYRVSQKLDLDVTAAAREELIKRGYSRDYGARNMSKVLNRFANIEVSKLLKRDAPQSTSDVAPVLSFLRSMREGKRPVDLGEAHAAVEEVARIRVPYRRVTIDFVGGELTYERD